MKIVFRVGYVTSMGQDLWLDLGLDDGGGMRRRMLPMSWVDGGHWEIEVNAAVSGEGRLEYGYVLKQPENGVELAEWGGRREAVVSGEGILFEDDWRSAGAVDSIYETDGFVSAERCLGKLVESVGDNHVFRLRMARVPEGLVPCLIGSAEELGGWDWHRVVAMVETEENGWEASLFLPMGERAEYKYGLLDVASGVAARLEVGENRVLEARAGMDLVRVCDEDFQREDGDLFRGAGVAIPVFSLRSRRGCGVGEFADLKGMGDWAKGAGLKMIQILPINDTTSTRKWTDSYPYSAISVNALHPLYLRLDELSYPLADEAGFVAVRDGLNELGEVDYEAVMAVKWRVSREVFEEHHDEIIRDKGFRGFLNGNREWVLPYGIFCVKRDEFGTADFTKWGEWAVYDKEAAEVLAISTGVIYFAWLQYELDRQLVDAVGYLRELGIGLKGDLPIGIDRESVDAWVSPRLFKMDAQAGAPPDAFAVKGQNWGFPTYDWEAMREDGYGWWRARFERLSRYFSAFRIDHVLGFFRIWQVPQDHVEGIMGVFDPALAVHLEEFAERGIEFDRDRFCRPYIREHSLVERFGDFADAVRRDYLVDCGFGFYGMKEFLDTQRKIEGWYEGLGGGDWARVEWLRDALMDCVSEVLFFEVEGTGGTLFHPRMSMMGTRSFKELEADQRWRVEELYVDYFYRRQEGLWEASGYEKLPVMRGASRMLLCGEDLGMVPGCVPGVMASLGLLSLEIQRMPKDAGRRFFHPKDALYPAVVSTGTHDMATLRGWWREDEETRAGFAWEMFGLAFPPDDLDGGMARRVVEQHLFSPAMWAVFPLQDLLAMDEGLRGADVEGERINVPSIMPFYWRWRMHLDLEDLAGEEGFAGMLREMMLAAGR